MQTDLPAPQPDFSACITTYVYAERRDSRRGGKEKSVCASLASAEGSRTFGPPSNKVMSTDSRLPTLDPEKVEKAPMYRYCKRNRQSRRTQCSNATRGTPCPVISIIRSNPLAYMFSPLGMAYVCRCRCRLLERKIVGSVLLCLRKLNGQRELSYGMNCWSLPRICSAKWKQSDHQRR